MKARILTVLLLSSQLMSAHAQPEIRQEDIKEAQAVVSQMQKLPEKLMFCDTAPESRGDAALADKKSILAKSFNPIYLQYFSKEFYPLFMWVQCVTPKRFRLLHEEKGYHWDFRYGTEAMGGSEYVKNIRVETPRATKGGKLTVQVIWDNGDIKDTWTRYTLVKENGTWKIDDIALKGFVLDIGTEGTDELLPSSKSLKTELQAAYKRAEKKYNRDQAAKGSSKK